MQWNERVPDTCIYTITLKIFHAGLSAITCLLLWKCMSYDLISVIPDRVSTSHDQPRPPEAQHCALGRHKQESEGTNIEGKI